MAVVIEGLPTIYALVRSSSLPPEVNSLVALQNFVRHETTSHRYKPPKWALPPVKLSLQVPADVLRAVLATHRKILCLTISCLSFYLKRFKPLRPSHLVDENYFFESQDVNIDGKYSHFYPAWQKWPPVMPCPVVDVGPPTWVEEQRVLRAFWRVQLIHDMRTPRDIADLDFLKLNGMSVVVLYDVPYDTWMDSISLNGQGGPDPTIFQQDGLLEHELIWSVVEYTEQDQQTIEAPTFLQTKRDWQVPTSQKPPDSECCPINPSGDCSMNCYTSLTYTRFCRMAGSWGQHITVNYCSPLQHVSFDPFRRLGFAIWDSERMRNYGLLARGNSFDTAWRSILGPDDIAEVERKNQERDEVDMRRHHGEYDSDDSDDFVYPNFYTPERWNAQARRW